MHMSHDIIQISYCTGQVTDLTERGICFNKAKKPFIHLSVVVSSKTVKVTNLITSASVNGLFVSFQGKGCFQEHNSVELHCLDLTSCNCVLGFLCVCFDQDLVCLCQECKSHFVGVVLQLMLPLNIVLLETLTKLLLIRHTSIAFIKACMAFVKSSIVQILLGQHSSLTFWAVTFSVLLYLMFYYRDYSQ